MLFTTDWLLQRWLKDITVETKSDIISSAERTELQQLVNEVTQLVNQAQSIIPDKSHPLDDLVTIISSTPNDIQLHNFTLNYTTPSLEVAGTATTRDALVAYQQVMTAVPGMTGVYLPLQDITSKEQVPFTIQATYETAPLDKTE